MLAKNPTEWRHLVLSNNSYTCQLCGSHAVYATYMKSSLGPTPELDPDNGVSLCPSCRKKYGDWINLNRLEYRIPCKGSDERVVTLPNPVADWLIKRSESEIVQLHYLGLPFIVLAPPGMKLDKEILKLAVIPNESHSA